jgi:BirA family biotin operon repressor/biotin-[acetyl-CoA-carboxylase] ligase
LIFNSFDNPGLVKVLKFLQTHNTEYLSGQDLSDVLRISRVAIWKHIKKIQELGYVVESKQKLGYKLISNSNLLLPWEITNGLKTQNQALKMADNPTNNGSVIIAEKQTGGKGRSGRKWVSPKGGIWLSLILYPKFDISITTLFPIASSLALSKSIEQVFKISPELKWPNDLTIKSKKIAGMLVDVSLESNKIEKLVLGVGINFDVDVKNIEKKLKNTPNFYGVASLGDYKKDVKAPYFVQVFFIELEKIYESLNKRDIKKIILEWTKRSSTIGKEVEIDTVNGKVKGKAIKIDDDGALVVNSNNKIIKIIAGDVIHL